MTSRKFSKENFPFYTKLYGHINMYTVFNPLKKKIFFRVHVLIFIEFPDMY